LALKGLKVLGIVYGRKLLWKIQFCDSLPPKYNLYWGKKNNAGELFS